MLALFGYFLFSCFMLLAIAFTIRGLIGICQLLFPSRPGYTGLAALKDDPRFMPSKKA